MKCIPVHDWVVVRADHVPPREMISLAAIFSAGVVGLSFSLSSSYIS